MPDRIKATINDAVRTFIKSDYVYGKTRDLQEYGYTSLSEAEVEAQLNKVLDGEEGLSVIGHFIKGDKPERI